MHWNRRQVLQQWTLGACALAAGKWSRSVCADSASSRKERPPIRIGQIGVAHGHANKIQVYRNSADYDVVGIVEPDPELRQQAQADPLYQGLPWMTREELLSIPDLQAVLIETRIRDSLENAEASLQAGKHVHLDKPAGASLSRFQEILHEAERRQLMVQLGYMYRYNPGILLIQEFVRNGWLGEIFELHAVMSKVVTPEMRVETAEFSGGMMFELGCHLIDLAVTLLGKPQQVTSILQHVSAANDALQDNCLAVLEYPKAIATIVSSAQEVEGFRRRQLSVCGTGGTIHLQPLDQPTATISLEHDCGEYRAGTHEVVLPKFSRYVADAAEMAQVIRGEASPRFSYRHDYDVQETVLTASRMR